MNRLPTGWGRRLVVLGVVLSLAACSTKGTSDTTTQDSSEQTRPAPLQGFSKTLREEAVRPPLMARVDPSEFEKRHTQEVAQRELGDVYFEFDRWGLSPEGQKNLAQNADALRRSSTARILIEGHCDERGSTEYNLVLGEKRAQETRRQLLLLGITNPVNVTSYGKERPACTEHDESCYWKNRWAHLVLETNNGQ